MFRKVRLLHLSRTTNLLCVQDQALEAIEALVTIGESTPELFTKSLSDVFQAMIQIATSQQVEESVQQIAVEFCLTLAENDARHTKKVARLFVLSCARGEGCPWGIISVASSAGATLCGSLFPFGNEVADHGGREKGLGRDPGG